MTRQSARQLSAHVSTTESVPILWEIAYLVCVATLGDGRCRCWNAAERPCAAMEDAAGRITALIQVRQKEGSDG